MPVLPGNSGRVPPWIVIALMLATIFAAVHGVAGLVTGSVLVPGSHGHYASLLSDTSIYEGAEAFWLIGACAFGIAGVTLARKYFFRKSSARQAPRAEK